MNKGPSIFKKSRLAIGLAAAGLLAAPAHSVTFEVAGLDVKFDSTFTLATSIRMENRDLSKIGNSNQFNLDWTGYNMTTNVVYQGEDIWALNDGVGSYSTNGDNGNLNFDRGDAFSRIASGVHELEVTGDNWGFFVRGFYFYDFELMDGDRAWQNPLSSQLGGMDGRSDLCSEGRAKENACSDIRFLDAFVWYNFDLGEMPVEFRFGEQVVNWGESTFIQHGVNTINAVDVARARTPGAELREIFIPVGTAYTSIGLTENVSFDFYYQFAFRRSILPVSGTYFATNDFAGDNGHLNNIQLSFTRNPDIDQAFLIDSLNSIGAAVNAGASRAQMAEALLAHGTKVAVRPVSDNFYQDADEQGQYGLKLSYFMDWLNDTEVSFYHLNYHSKRPLLNGIAANYTTEALMRDLDRLAAAPVTSANITDLESLAQAQAVFPEDIKLYGMSFNTNIGETSLAGEISYRPDEPLQIDDVSLLYTAFPEQLANIGAQPALAGISQVTALRGATEPGGFISGIVELDTLQIQATVSHVFGPRLGADNLILLGEVGYISISDMPDPSVLALETPGTARSVPLVPLQNPDG